MGEWRGASDGTSAAQRNAAAQPGESTQADARAATLPDDQSDCVTTRGRSAAMRTSLRRIKELWKGRNKDENRKEG